MSDVIYYAVYCGHLDSKLNRNVFILNTCIHASLVSQLYLWSTQITVQNSTLFVKKSDAKVKMHFEFLLDFLLLEFLFNEPEMKCLNNTCI